MDSRPAFTLRFRREETHRALRHAADELGVSMNELAERAIEHELAVIGNELEDKFRRTAGLLRRYRMRVRAEAMRGRRSPSAADIERIAHAEVTEDDPLRSRADDRRTDPLGVGKAFADPLE